MAGWKLGRLDDSGNEHEYLHPNRWQRERTAGPDRLAISTIGDYTDLLLALASALEEPFGVLYVLLVSRTGLEPGRYQKSEPATPQEIDEFVREYARFLEGDGRHHLWLTSLPGNSTLVYDNHNIVYAYGELEAFESTLRELGLSEGPVTIPAPHCHRYHAEFDSEEESILRHWRWLHFPLEAGDDD